MKTKLTQADVSWFDGMEAVSNMLGHNSSMSSRTSSSQSLSSNPSFVQTNALLQSLIFSQTQSDLLDAWKNIKWKSVVLPHQLIMSSLNPWAIKHAPFDWLTIPSSTASSSLSAKSKKSPPEQFSWGGHRYLAEKTWLASYVLDDCSYQDWEKVDDFLSLLSSQHNITVNTPINTSIFGGREAPSKIFDVIVTYSCIELVEKMWGKVQWDSPQSAQETIHAFCNRVLGNSRRGEDLCRFKAKMVAPIIAAQPDFFAPLQNSEPKDGWCLAKALVKCLHQTDGMIFKSLTEVAFSQLSRQPLQVQNDLADFLVDFSKMSMHSGEHYYFLDLFGNNASPQASAHLSRSLLHSVLESDRFRLHDISIGVDGFQGHWGIDEARALLPEFAQCSLPEIFDYRKKKHLPDLIECFDASTQKLVEPLLMSLYDGLKKHDRMTNAQRNQFLEQWVLKASLIGHGAAPRAPRKM